MPQKFFERTPVVVAIISAVAIVGVSIAGAIGAAITAHSQQQTDIAKLKTTILLSLVLRIDDATRAEYARTLIQAGVLPDEDGAVCMAFVRKGCPLKVLKPN